MADDKTIAAFHELERSRYAKLRQAVEEHKAAITRAGEVMFCDLFLKHLKFLLISSRTKANHRHKSGRNLPLVRALLAGV